MTEKIGSVGPIHDSFVDSYNLPAFALEKNTFVAFAKSTENLTLRSANLYSTVKDA